MLRDQFLDFISGIEEGNSTHEKLAKIAEQLDPVLVYFALRYIRETHPAQDPRASGVAERLIELMSTHPSIVARSKKGEKDSLREWFDETLTMRSYSGKTEEFVDLIIEKFDS